MNHRSGSNSRGDSGHDPLVLEIWERCRHILGLRRRWSLVWVEACQLPLNRSGLCLPNTGEVLLEKNLSEERTIVALAHEAKQAALYEAGETTRNDAEPPHFARWFFVQHGMDLLMNKDVHNRISPTRDESESTTHGGSGFPRAPTRHGSMPDESMRKRRKYPRVGPVVIRCVFSLGDEATEGYLMSLSEGGAFLSTSSSIAIGKTISLRVSLPWQMGNILTDAQVIHAIGASGSGPHESTPGVGVCFLNLTPEDQERIRRYVTKFHELTVRLEEGKTS